MIYPPIRYSKNSAYAVCFALIGICVGAGCGQHGTNTLLQPAPRSVSISLAHLAQLAPEWSSITQLDEVTRFSIQQPQPVPLLVSPTISPQSSAKPSQLHSVQQMSAARREASIKAASGLTVVAERAVSQVRARLERNQTRLRALAQDRAAKQISAGLADAKDKATRDYLAKLPLMLQESSSARANLRVQITALGVNANPANPPTAPAGYWSNLLAARQAELANLTDTQRATQRQAEQQIAIQVQAARVALQKAADAQLAEYDASLDARSAQVLARQHDALQKEQAELTTVSADLDTELNQPLRTESNSAILNTPSKSITAGGALDAVSAAAVLHLHLQRERLEQTILDTTRKRVIRAAGELNLKIVDWNSRKPDTKAMDALSKQMSRDVTG